MSKEAYLESCRVMGKHPDPDFTPIGADELGYLGKTAQEMYNKLGGRYLSTMEGGVYLGKDWTQLPVLYRVFQVFPENERSLFEILHAIDEKEVAASLAAHKRNQNPR